MSIIYEALKKVETATQNKPGKIENTQRPWQKKRLPILLISIMLLFLIGYIYVNSFSNWNPLSLIVKNKSKSKRIDKEEISVFVNIPAHSSIKQNKVASAIAKEQYILEGIVLRGQENKAIINGQIVKRDESLGKMKVVEITQDKVTLWDSENDSRVDLDM